jgi:hypothetical protein
VLIAQLLKDELVSRAFSGRAGPAFLLRSACAYIDVHSDLGLTLHDHPAYLASVNVKLAKAQQKMLLTGMHTISNLTCLGCGSSLGWVYLKAEDPAQKYKEGKYILEKVSTEDPHNLIIRADAGLRHLGQDHEGHSGHEICGTSAFADSVHCRRTAGLAKIQSKAGVLASVAVSFCSFIIGAVDICGKIVYVALRVYNLCTGRIHSTLLTEHRS